MKKFYSAEDIEALADQGHREIFIDSNTVMTDLAKNTADMLGVRIRERSAGGGPAATSAIPVRAVSLRPAGAPMGGKPKGCQHRPAGRQQTAPQAAAGPVVDKLVESIKRLGQTQ